MGLADFVAAFTQSRNTGKTLMLVNVPRIKVGGERRMTSQSDWQEITLDADTNVFTDPGMYTDPEMQKYDRAELEPPCLRFLDLYSKAEWAALISELHPALLETVPGDQIEAQVVED